MVGWWVLALLFHSETLLWLSLSVQTLAVPHLATPNSRTNLLYPHRKLGRTFPRPHIIFYSWHDYGNTPWNWRPWSLPCGSTPPLLSSLWPGIHPHYSVGIDPVKIPVNTMGGFNHDPPASGLFNHGSTETLLNSKALRLPKRRGEKFPDCSPDLIPLHMERILVWLNFMRWLSYTNKNMGNCSANLDRYLGPCTG